MLRGRRGGSTDRSWCRRGVHRLAAGQPQRVAGVMPDQPAIRVEGQADALVAERVALVLPAKVLQRARRVRKAAVEEVDDLPFVARPKSADGEALVHGRVSWTLNGHASARPSGWRGDPPARRRGAWPRCGSSR